MPLQYNVTALEMPIYFNSVRLDANTTCKGDTTNVNKPHIVGGDHDHSGLMYALTINLPLLKYIRALINREDPDEWEDEARALAATLQMPFPTNRDQATLPHPLVRPLVLRAAFGETVNIHFCNEIRDRRVGMHLVADGYDVKTSDGAWVGNNPSSLAAFGECIDYVWQCNNEGVFVFHDGGNLDGLEEDNEDPQGNPEQNGSSNLRGLFGAFAVEPENAIWRDPVTGRRSAAPAEKFVELDGLYMDILFPDDLNRPPSTEKWPRTEEYPTFCRDAHREYVIVFHDEPAFVPPHLPDGVKPAGDPCRECEASGHGGHGGGHGEAPPIMPISYRAEPMVNREQELFRLLCKKPEPHDFKGRPVLHEEQHHSSWMFGDPATPILKAYIGDPVRIRLVHGGVKETHVFHLHLYEWHAAPQDRDSPRIDAISFSPQTGHTIEPVWGAGNRHQVPGDVIWHCHLYPHFHEGMWGMFRTFETLQTGEVGEELYIADNSTGDTNEDSNDGVTDAIYAGRRIGQYPDGTPIENLLPLPGRPEPPLPTSQRPGFPLFIPGECRQKSPRPPWPDRKYEEGEKRWCGQESLLAGDMPDKYDYRKNPTFLERRAFNPRPVPGEMFTYNPLRDQQGNEWAAKFSGNGNTDDDKEKCYPVGVTNRPVLYNHRGWVDPNGHFYYLQDNATPPAEPSHDPEQREPLFFRAQHGQILNLTLENLTDEHFNEDRFDHALPPCDARPWQGECAMHVHMVKFDPICADGASTGWNYMSGAVHGKKMVYRWWLDQEFGTIFFHDHLFANYRQKRGLFGGLIVEPVGAKFFSNFEDKEIVSGLQARIFRPESNMLKGTRYTGREGTWVREFCLALADFVPLYDRFNNPRNALNPPHMPGGHGDQGVMAINYRNEPITLRSGDPAKWFSSHEHGDPSTTGFAVHAGDPIWFRILQGSHEEQHSFQIHAMRWLRFRVDTGSAIRNQQTFGISEAFTFAHEEHYKPGDYLYKLSGADDLWLGCWGLIRAFPRPGESPLPPGEVELAVPASSGAPKPEDPPASTSPHRNPEVIPEPWPLEVDLAPPLPSTGTRKFHIEVVERRLVYRQAGGVGEADIIDPFGLVYRVIGMAEPGGNLQPVTPTNDTEPLVIRCREGETVEVTLFNRIEKPKSLAVEPHAPLVPLDDPDRPVSPRVSLHADLVLYDVRDSDGASVGLNPYQTVPPGYKITYSWKTARPERLVNGVNEANNGQPLGPVLLQDMADFRHHRHHGLVGALVIEAHDAVPRAVAPGAATAAAGAPEAWYGARATVTTTTVEEPIEEMVLLMQDGLRLYWNGDTRQPLPDPPEEEGGADYEDQGQKGFSYGTEPRGPHFDTRGRPDLLPHEWLRTPTPAPLPTVPWPATPRWHVRAGSCVHLHLVGACDKPRNHSFTVHGAAWPEARFPRQDPNVSPSPEPCPNPDDHFKISSESAVTSGTVRTFRFSPQHGGDYAYRSGALRWDVPQGMWGILRVESGTESQPGCARIRVASWASLVFLLGLLAWRKLRKDKE